MHRICTMEVENLWIGSARLRCAVGPSKYLVTGAAAADPPAATTCRWSSRVKRRFLAARRPARRVGERLKAPHTANARWQGPAAAGGGPSSSRPSSPPSPGRSSSGEEEEEEEDGRPTDYLTPGCYDLDGAGRPVCAGDPAAAGGGPGAAAGLFGVPLSAPRVPQVPVPRAGPQPGLAETLDSLRRLAVGGDQRPAAAGLGSSPRSSESTRSCSGGSEPAGSSPRGPDGAGSSPRGPDGADSSPRGTDGADSSPRGTDGAGSSPRGPGGADSSPRGPDGADSSPRGTDGADSELSGTPRDADGPAEDWMTSSFDEDWFLSTEREEREEEEARRRAEEEDQRRRRGGGAEGEESQTRREARRHESESESELSGQTSALRATPQSQ
ncbi:hypothetical protein FJT64_026288 [Amphibalanus amphitrite]|uniref:Uncharacterized protein n=1 Tax=Amphibalanus amphitrite TaxID=1232801 RepID=A0A6A4WCJ5_AMPAM|nr:hypothetical protein FJT64_026288 [Amphibalanus amphitrite]